MAAGYALISVNYQLLPPATGHEILEDITDLFGFIENDINDLVKARGRDDHIDSQRIAVIGTSAGGLCAYLAGIHARPKPRAIISMYGMGGDFFVRSFHLVGLRLHPLLLQFKTPHYLTTKSTPFFRGRELLNPESFSEFMYPNSSKIPSTSSSGLSYHGADHSIPGYPSNPRMLLARLYLQLGNIVDYYTGEHEPSISERLRACLGANDDTSPRSWLSIIPPIHKSLFPQFNLSAFPPTFLIHGSKDTAVPVEESYNLHEELQSRGIATVLRVCDGMEHSFDYQADAEQRWSTVFDEAFQFLKVHLSPAEATSSG
jgi:acetyl esterase/lipase